MFPGWGEAQDDPCDIAQALPNNYIGSRNEHCNEGDVRTDCDNFLNTGWYKVEGSTILTHCPQTGSCGVTYPVWINGKIKYNTVPYTSIKWQSGQSDCLTSSPLQTSVITLLLFTW